MITERRAWWIKKIYNLLNNFKNFDNQRLKRFMSEAIVTWIFLIPNMEGGYALIIKQGLRIVNFNSIT